MGRDINTRPRVSVAIPAYNAGDTIEAAVKSVLRQSAQKVEVIVCNDASTDDTLRILHSIDDPRLVILDNASNQGEGITRDRALMAARGEWVAVLDADDIFDEHRLEVMLAATCGETDVIVFDDLLVCHHTPVGLVPWRRMRGEKAFGANGEPFIDIRPEAWASSHQFLIKPLIHTDTLHRLGVRHSTLKFGADTEFFLKLIAAGLRLRYVPQAGYLYRITPNSASANSMRSELMNGMLESMLPSLQHLPKLQEAIRQRIRYRTFVKDLKAGRLLAAAKIGFKNPSIIAEFGPRAVRQAIYHGHRLLHSGSSR